MCSYTAIIVVYVEPCLPACITTINDDTSH